MIPNILTGRETKADYLFNVFFGSAIVTVLAIRGFLAITNYPQLGGNGLHIAHMLWGGLFMLAAVVSLLYFHGFRVKFASALLAGIGFGFFIDELGKFITSDNDYFYKPTAMLIYVIFVLLWALFAWLAKYVASTRQEKAVDAFSKLRDAIIYGISEKDIKAIRRQLIQAGCSPDEADGLLAVTSKMIPKHNENSLWQKITKFAEQIHTTFDRVAIYKWTKYVLLVIFLAQAVFSFLLVGLLLFAQLRDFMVFDVPSTTPPFIFYGLVLTLFANMYCVFVGFVNFIERRSQQVFVWYRRALLVNIFGTQVFLFYTNQFQAAFGLIVSLLLFAFVNELAHHVPAAGTRKTKQ